jgi:endoglucanase
MRDESGFHVLLFPGEYFWGSNSHILNKAVLLILSYIETNNESYLEVALDQLHYILGVNAHNMSFVTGVGKKMPLHPHHRPSSSDGIEEPIPGLLVGGANQYLQDPTLQAHFDTSTPPGLCYIDNEGSWSSNEIAINWNAPLVFVSAYFNGYGCQNSVNSPHILLPDEIKIFQNYPNPFNKQTIIEFSLPYKQTVKFKVFDINGKRVFEEKINGEVSGNNVIRWDGRNNNGQVLCSGIYLYCVEGEQISNIKKMVFLK